MFALVALNWNRPGDPRIPLGHASLVAALAEAEVPHRGFVVDLNGPEPCVVRLAREILDANPGIIGIGCYVWNEAFTQKLVPQLRAQGFHGIIVLGGPQITYAGPGVEDLYPDVDVFVRGYAEDALVEIARGHRPVGAHFRGESDLARQATVDLVNLPSPWTSGALPIDSGLVRMETQRGCIFKCSFCQHPGHSSSRPLSKARVDAETELFGLGGVRKIAVLDPIFNHGPHQLRVLERLDSMRWRGDLSLQCRFELLSDEFIELAQPLRPQLEFGLQTIHEAEGRAVMRPNDMDRVSDAVARLHAASLYFEVTLIYGLPNQTLESFRETLAWCEEHRVPTVRAFPLVLLRGTQLHRDAGHWGLVEDDSTIPQVVASNSFSRDDHAEMARLAASLVLARRAG